MGEYYGVRREGEPYIEHFGLPKGWVKEGHKYIARIKNAAGDGYRYIYTQAELAAAQGRKAARAVGKITKDTYKVVRKATGLSARDRAQATAARAERYTHPTGRGQAHPNPKQARMARATARNAQAAYDKTLLGRAEKMFNSGRKAVNDTVNNASKQANKLYKQAGKAVDDAGRYVNKQVRGAQNAVEGYQKFRKLSPEAKVAAVVGDAIGNKKAKGARQAMKLWNVEQAIRNAPGNAAKAIGDTYERGRKAVDSGIRQAGKTARKVGRDVNRELRNAGRAVDKGLDNVSKATGYKALKRSTKTRYRANMVYQGQNKRANATARAAHDAYMRTPLGKVDNAVSNVVRTAMFGNQKKNNLGKPTSVTKSGRATIRTYTSKTGESSRVPAPKKKKKKAVTTRTGGKF